MRLFLLYVFVVLCPLFSSAQVRTFALAEEGEHLTLLCLSGDTVLVAIDSAYVLSPTTYATYLEFGQLYATCIESRRSELAEILDDFLLLLNQSDQLLRLIDAGDALGHRALSETATGLVQTLVLLSAGLVSLEEIQTAIDQAKEELEGIESQIRKTQKNLWWSRVGGWAISGMAGLLIGVLLF